MDFNYKIILRFILIINCIINFSCRKLEIERITDISEINITNISLTTAIAKSKIIDYRDKVVKFGHCWSETPNPTIVNSKSSFVFTDTTENVVSFISNLSPNKKYYIRSYITTTKDTEYGSETSFSTMNFTPSQVVTTNIQQISGSTVEVKGEITLIGVGISQILQFGHCWSQNRIPTVYDQKTKLGSTDSLLTFISTANSISPGIEYNYRSYLISEVDTVYGNTVDLVTYITKPVVKLKVTDITSGENNTVDTTNIYNVNTSTFINVKSIVSDNGGSKIELIGLAFKECPNIPDINSLNSNYKEINPDVNSISLNFSNLSPNTCYNFIAYAQNSAGISYSGIIQIIPEE